jgi:hypothetical protein
MMKVVSERLGRATVSITLDTYSHVIPALQAEAADTVAAMLTGPRRLEVRLKRARKPWPGAVLVTSHPTDQMTLPLGLPPCEGGS